MTEKVWFITGAGRGLGHLLSRDALRAGDKVVATSRSVDGLAESLSAPDDSLLVLPLDVTDARAASAAHDAAMEVFGRIDILVNNAGFGYFAPLVEMDFEAMEKLYRTNVFGPFLMAREAARHFIEQGSGNLINISSTSGLKGGKGATAYSSSKFALRGMTECWRDELRRHNVRVMLVNPSEVLTDFAERAGYAQTASEKKLRAREIADAIVGALEIDDRGFIPEFSVFATNPF